MTKREHVVFIHGLGCGGDVWNPMKTALESQGWHCSAPTLLENARPLVRPIGAAPDIGLHSYLNDARRACSGITHRTGCKPIIIGHSMGGLIAQALACEGVCSRAVLVTPAPPKAVANRSLWMPWLFANVLLSGKHDRYHRAWRTGVYHVMLNRVHRANRGAIFSRMRFEPGQLFVDMTQGMPLGRASLAAPTLVIAAGHDRVVSARVVKRTAAHYSGSGHPCDLLTYPAHGHWIIDEPDNKAFVSNVIAWLEQEPRIPQNNPLVSPQLRVVQDGQ